MIPQIYNYLDSFNMFFSIIACKDLNDGIGYQNQLPWGFLRSDMRWFKERTLNHPVLMGRKTADSIEKALVNRQNIVLTRDKNYKRKDFIIIYSLDELNELNLMNDEIFVIGGSEIYSMILKDQRCKNLYLTNLFKDYNVDTYFPWFNKNDYNVDIIKKDKTFEILKYEKKE